jgi:hypothetical protein
VRPACERAAFRGPSLRWVPGSWPVSGGADSDYNRRSGAVGGGGLEALQLARGPFWGWRSALPLLLLLLAGGVFALATTSAGRADDPPPTTVSTPTVPAPVPAPAPPLKVQPPRKLPAPKTTARKAPQAATPAPPVASTPVQSAPTVVAHPAQVRPKKAKIRAHKVHRKAPVVKPTPQRTLGASVSFRNHAGTKSTSSFDVGSLVIILGLAIAIACFSFALIPARALPWRQVATFRSERQVDMTLIGLALLVTTLMLYLMTRA